MRAEKIIRKTVVLNILWRQKEGSSFLVCLSPSTDLILSRNASFSFFESIEKAENNSSDLFIFSTIEILIQIDYL